MKNETLIKCSNCGGNDFKPTTIGTILATEGRFTINAYACQCCGHVELFDPNLDLYAKQLQAERELQRKKEELAKKKAAEELQRRISELESIINNEDSTIRQVKEAKIQLEKLNSQNRMRKNFRE